MPDVSDFFFNGGVIFLLLEFFLISLTYPSLVNEFFFIRSTEEFKSDLAQLMCQFLLIFRNIRLELDKGKIFFSGHYLY